MTRSRKPIPQNFNPPKLCGGKYCYTTRHDAEMVIQEKIIMQPEISLTLYRCLDCRHYHLTRNRDNTDTTASTNAYDHI